MRSKRSDRETQIEGLIRTLKQQGIGDERVLDALRSVPRDRFVPDDLRDHAWENHALPIAGGQTISQPYVVAAMTEALRLSGDERVLEIGTGSGYQAAVLATLASHVVSVERIPELARTAVARLREMGYQNITVREGDGSMGVPEESDWDAIIVTAGAPAISQQLLNQLNPNGGRMVVPVGPPGEQRLVVIRREGRRYTETDLGAVAFVPLIGSGGWPDAAGDGVDDALSAPRA